MIDKSSVNLKRRQTFGILETISYVTPAPNILSCKYKHSTGGREWVTAAPHCQQDQGSEKPGYF